MSPTSFFDCELLRCCLYQNTHSTHLHRPARAVSCCPAAYSCAMSKRVDPRRFARSDRCRTAVNLVCICIAAAALLSTRRTGATGGRRLLFSQSEPGIPFDVEQDGTIFVSISSYRDPECAATLEHMYDFADEPRRVFVAVCEQNLAPPGSSEDCTTGHLPPRLRSNVDIIRINASEAKGPTLGRALNARQFRSQDYFMQIDSHTKFAPGWDTMLVRMHQRAAGCVPKPVLTTYPTAHDRMDSKAVPRICNASATHDGIFRFQAALDLSPRGHFVATPFAAAGFMFGPGAMVSEVPFDPELPYLFDGEELLYSARLWTAGFDLLAPTANAVFHRYGNRAASVFADHGGQHLDAKLAQTKLKVKYLLGLGTEKPGPELAANMSAYSMGSARELSEYYRFGRFDLEAQQCNAQHWFCGDAPFANWAEDSCLAALAAEWQQAQQAAARARRRLR